MWSARELQLRWAIGVYCRDLYGTVERYLELRITVEFGLDQTRS